MPTLSAANNTTFAASSRIRPATDIPRASRPNYAYHFYADGTFYDAVNFDNCREYIHFEKSITYQDIDFSNQDMYYKRLYRFRRPINGCRFYLCPWLIVPFEQQASGSYAATINGPQGSVQTLSLTVKPFSIFETSISEITKKRIAQNNTSTSNSRTLELYSSGNGVHAVWDNPKSPSTPEVIDEAACVTPQKITVVINSAASAYSYSSYLDIRTSPSNTVGRIYFVFLENMKRSAIFFEVSQIPGANAGTNTHLDVKMLSVAESKSRIDQLNEIFRLSGMVYTDPGVSVKRNDQTTLTPGGSIQFDVGQLIDPNSGAQPQVVTDKFRTEIAQINNTTWTSQDRTYLLVFQLSYVNVIQVKIVGNVKTTTITRGDSNTGTSTARVYGNERKTLAHESAHGLGLQHWFHDLSDDLTQIGQVAEGYAKKIGILSTQQLYSFHDDWNSNGLGVALTNQWTEFKTATPSARLNVLRYLFYPRMYGQFLTDNLMDYQQNGLPLHQEQLRKHQAEQMRNF